MMRRYAVTYYCTYQRYKYHLFVLVLHVHVFGEAIGEVTINGLTVYVLDVPVVTSMPK
jgi:hypothetical protein